MRGGHSAASAGGRRAAASAQRSVAQATLQIAISEDRDEGRQSIRKPRSIGWIDSTSVMYG